MLTFLDGPATECSRQLCVRRTPRFLRVVRKTDGTWDCLDQLHDTPEPDEAIFAYEKVSDDGTVHVDRTVKGRRVGEWYRLATYRLVAEQPDEPTMRDTEKWRAWATAQMKARPAHVEQPVVIRYDVPSGGKIVTLYVGPPGTKPVQDRADARRFPNWKAAEDQLAAWRRLRGGDDWLLGRAVIEDA